MPNQVQQIGRIQFADNQCMPKTKYLEMFQSRQLLRLLDNTDDLEFPVCVEHRDKPDFLLSSRYKKIGLETTSFTDEELWRANHLHSDLLRNEFITTTGLRDGPVRRSNDEIIDTMLNFQGPWEDAAEGTEHAALKIFESIRLKNQTFQSPTFDKFDENWLLLTDYESNRFPDSVTDKMIIHRLATTPSNLIRTDFDRIYILYGPRCFRIKHGKLSIKLDRKLRLS